MGAPSLCPCPPYGNMPPAHHCNRKPSGTPKYYFIYRLFCSAAMYVVSCSPNITGKLPRPLPAVVGAGGAQTGETDIALDMRRKSGSRRSGLFVLQGPWEEEDTGPLLDSSPNSPAVSVASGKQALQSLGAVAPL